MAPDRSSRSDNLVRWRQALEAATTKDRTTCWTAPAEPQNHLTQSLFFCSAISRALVSSTTWIRITFIME
jgi:hypothetical protein